MEQGSTTLVATATAVVNDDDDGDDAVATTQQLPPSPSSPFSPSSAPGVNHDADDSSVDNTTITVNNTTNNNNNNNNSNNTTLTTTTPDNATRQNGISSSTSVSARDGGASRPSWRRRHAELQPLRQAVGYGGGAAHQPTGEDLVGCPPTAGPSSMVVGALQQIACGTIPATVCLLASAAGGGGGRRRTSSVSRTVPIGRRSSAANVVISVARTIKQQVITMQQVPADNRVGLN